MIGSAKLMREYSLKSDQFGEKPFA